MKSKKEIIRNMNTMLECYREADTKLSANFYRGVYHGLRYALGMRGRFPKW